ncbi:pentatricopeptide repeat-containing protein 2, mitochondrial isoform X1 [Procambarus clarkii]|uniref:pentatricopeptide repeat-containing protein 2, mitochondrial isoform X1 n=2 Tax=Procambarus clarkii TaxID=6728 RepID=UPI003743E50E
MAVSGVSGVSNIWRAILTGTPTLCGSRVANLIRPSGCCHLFAPSALGIDNYISGRERTAIHYEDKTEKFKKQMRESMSSKDRVMVFTEDLKNAIHLTEASEEDLSLVSEMIKKFNQQHQGLRFGAFVFGPVVMRMYYYLNQPDAALAALQAKEMEGFFDQMASYQIAMSLLYKNEKYQEVLDVFELLQEKRIGGIRYPKNCFTIAVATLYKLNTQESLTKVLKLFEHAEEYGMFINRRLIIFAAALALKQNHPHIALELLSKSTVTHISVCSIKVMALCEQDQVEVALPLLRSLIQIDLPNTSKPEKSFRILSEAVLAAETALEKTGKKDLIAEFERIKKSLQENNNISDKKLDMIVLEPIEVFKKQEFRKQDKATLAASFYGKHQRRESASYHSHRRQGLADLE